MKVALFSVIIEPIRWFLISLCYITPKFMRHPIVNLIKRYPPWPEEEGCFRTDVATAAFGILRGGDIIGFQQLLGNYPFPERWEGMNKRIKVRYIKDRGWRVFTTYCEGIGKANIPGLPKDS